MAVAAALREAGHEVAFYSAARTKDLLDAEGWMLFPFRALDQDLAERLVGAVLAERRRPWRMWKYWQRFLLDTVPSQLSDLDAVLRRWLPDAIVCDISMLAPILVLHEARGVPVAVLCHLGHNILRASWQAEQGPSGLPPRGPVARALLRLVRRIADLATAGVPGRVSRLRSGNGLPPGRFRIVEMIAGMPLVLIPNAAELDYYYNGLPGSIRYVGPCLWPPEALADLSRRGNGRRSVLVDEGTLYPPEPRLLQAAARGLGTMPAEIRILAGKGRDLPGLGLDGLSGNVILQPWQPPGTLADCWDVFVTNGNTDSVMLALSRGIPLVVVPSTVDQHETALRVEASGAGVRLGEARCTPARLRKAVEQVLAGPGFRQQAQRLAGVLAGYGGPRKAAYLLAELARGRSGST